jgi:RNA polymerase sigma-70 factor (ECF subfamily)
MPVQSAITADEFQQWIEPLLDRAGAYAYAIVRSREDAEDAVQEAALRAFRALARYDRSRSFKGWWFSIIRNCCLDLLRKRKTQPEGEELMPDDLPSGQPNHSEELERGNMLAWGLSRLDPGQREIIELRYFGDCAYRDIAATLDIPIGTVMSRLHAARKALNDFCKGETR